MGLEMLKNQFTPLLMGRGDTRGKGFGWNPGIGEIWTFSRLKSLIQKAVRRSDPESACTALWGLLYLVAHHKVYSPLTNVIHRIQVIAFEDVGSVCPEAIGYVDRMVSGLMSELKKRRASWVRIENLFSVVKTLALCPHSRAPSWYAAVQRAWQVPELKAQCEGFRNIIEGTHYSELLVQCADQSKKERRKGWSRVLNMVPADLEETTLILQKWALGDLGGMKERAFVARVPLVWIFVGTPSNASCEIRPERFCTPENLSLSEALEKIPPSLRQAALDRHAGGRGVETTYSFFAQEGARIENWVRLGDLDEEAMHIHRKWYQWMDKRKDQKNRE